MTDRWLLKLTVGAIVSATLAGCASRAIVEATVKAPSYQAKVKTLFVVANMGSGLSNKYGDHAGEFASLLKNSLDQCGTETRVFVQNPGVQLSLTDTKSVLIAHALTDFKPDAVLDINWQVHQFDTRGGNSTSYLIALQDTATHTIVWKAQIDATSHWYPAEIFAESLINGMKKDALIENTCVPPLHQKLL